MNAFAASKLTPRCHATFLFRSTSVMKGAFQSSGSSVTAGSPDLNCALEPSLDADMLIGAWGYGRFSHQAQGNAGVLRFRSTVVA